MVHVPYDQILPRTYHSTLHISVFKSLPSLMPLSRATTRYTAASPPVGAHMCVLDLISPRCLCSFLHTGCYVIIHDRLGRAQKSQEAPLAHLSSRFDLAVRAMLNKRKSSPGCDWQVLSQKWHRQVREASGKCSSAVCQF